MSKKGRKQNKARRALRNHTGTSESTAHQRDLMMATRMLNEQYREAQLRDEVERFDVYLSHLRTGVLLSDTQICGQYGSLASVAVDEALRRWDIHHAPTGDADDSAPQDWKSALERTEREAFLREIWKDAHPPPAAWQNGLLTAMEPFSMARFQTVVGSWPVLAQAMGLTNPQASLIFPRRMTPVDFVETLMAVVDL